MSTNSPSNDINNITETKEEILHPAKEILQNKAYMYKLHHSLTGRSGYSIYDQITPDNMIGRWLQNVHKKYPNNKVINKLYEFNNNNNLYTYSNLLEDMIYLDTMEIYDVEKGDGNTVLFLLQRKSCRDYIKPDNIYAWHMGVVHNLQKIREKQKLELKLKELEQKVRQLSEENTELLLRPGGPVSIELGKKFLQLGEKLTTQL